MAMMVNDGCSDDSAISCDDGVAMIVMDDGDDDDVVTC